MLTDGVNFTMAEALAPERKRGSCGSMRDISAGLKRSAEMMLVRRVAVRSEVRTTSSIEIYTALYGFFSGDTRKAMPEKA